MDGHSVINPAVRWALGVLVYELMCEHLPFTGANDKEIVMKLKQGIDVVNFCDLDRQCVEIIKASGVAGISAAVDPMGYPTC